MPAAATSMLDYIDYFLHNAIITFKSLMKAFEDLLAGFTPEQLEKVNDSFDWRNISSMDDPSTKAGYYYINKFTVQDETLYLECSDGKLRKFSELEMFEMNEVVSNRKIDENNQAVQLVYGLKKIYDEYEAEKSKSENDK